MLSVTLGVPMVATLGAFPGRSPPCPHAGSAARDCCGTHAKPRSHDTSRIAWAKLMARVGEEFPLLCPGCGGDIRLIAFITEPGPIRKILTQTSTMLMTRQLSSPFRIGIIKSPRRSSGRPREIRIIKSQRQMLL